MLVASPARLASSMAHAIAQKLLRVASARLRPSVKPCGADAAMSTSPAPVRGLADVLRLQTVQKRTIAFAGKQAAAVPKSGGPARRGCIHHAKMLKERI